MTDPFEITDKHLNDLDSRLTNLELDLRAVIKEARKRADDTTDPEFLESNCSLVLLRLDHIVETVDMLWDTYDDIKIALGED